MTGLTPPPHGAWTGDDGKPIYFDSIDNSAYILGQAPAFGAPVVDLHRRRELHGSARGRGRRSGQSRSQHRLEVPVDGQGHLARARAEPGRHRLGLQPDHGPVREVRHDVQRRDVVTDADVLAGQVCRAGQRLGAGPDLSGPDRVRQVDHRVSEHQAVSPVEPRTISGQISSVRTIRSRSSI